MMRNRNRFIAWLFLLPLLAFPQAAPSEKSQDGRYLRERFQDGQYLLDMESKLLGGIARFTLAIYRDENGRLNVDIIYQKFQEEEEPAGNMGAAQAVDRLRVWWPWIRVRSVREEHGWLFIDVDAVKIAGECEPVADLGTVQVPLEKLDEAKCRKRLENHANKKEIEGLLDKFQKAIDEREKMLKRLEELQDQLKVDVSAAQLMLENALLDLGTLKRANEAIDRAIEKAKSVEDILGIALMGAGLGKMALKKVLQSPKALNLLRHSPDALVKTRRLAEMYREGTEELAEAMKELDAIRRQAVDKAIKEMKLVEGEHFNFIGKKPGSKGWRGIDSDIDLEFNDPARAKEFEQNVVKHFNDLRGTFNRIDEAGQLKVNTFDGNLARYDVTTKAGYDEWRRAVCSEKYLANKDAYRTYGAQKFAASYKAPTAMEPIDGYDIVMEMSSRGQIILKTKNYIDPDVLSQLIKTYERAKVGEEIMKGNVKEILPGFKTDPFLDELAQDARKLLEQQRFNRTEAGKLADQMVEKMRQMAENARRPASNEWRTGASQLGMGLLLGETTGKFPFEAMEVAARQWAKELKLSGWQALVLDPKKLSIGSVIAGALEVGFNLGTYIAYYGPGQFIDKSILKDLVEKANHWGNAAADRLYKAGEKQRYLEDKVSEFKPFAVDLLRTKLDESLDGVPSDFKECFHLMIHRRLSELWHRFDELKGSVDRVRMIREQFATTKRILDEISKGWKELDPQSREEMWYELARVLPSGMSFGALAKNLKDAPQMFGDDLGRRIAHILQVSQTLRGLLEADAGAVAAAWR